MTRQDDISERHDSPATTSKRQRIAKLMARAGLCSRRDAEAWIVDGRVSVNDEILTSPAMDVSPDDRILVDGEPMPIAEKTRLFLFHKPRGLVTSDHDPEGRRTVADFLRETWPDGPRVVTIGRLDINTEGLLLLTNDGGLARLLELPQTGWVRRYRVRAKGTPDVGALEALAAGVTIDGMDYAGIEAKLDRVQGANCWLTMGLREGKNREVKRVLEHVGLEVNRLIRLSFGPFQLLELPEGAVEEVRTRVLRDQLGPTLAAQAGVDFGDAEPVDRPKPEADRARAPRQRAEVPRNDRRRPVRAEPSDEPAPIRERPEAGTRKHVGTLRASRHEDAKAGPRKRIERSDTRDRRDRAVVVERLVSTRPPERVVRRRRPGDEPPPPREAGGRDAGERKARGETRGSAPPRRHASPSADAKNVRRSRSGGAPERNAPGAQRERSGGFGAEARSTSRPPRGERPERAERRPERAERRPERMERSGPGRDRPAPDSRPGSPPRQRPAEARGRPRDESARSERPKSDRPRFDKPRSERPNSDRPRSDRPSSDRPKFDKPKFEKPKFDRPRFDGARPDRDASGKGPRTFGGADRGRSPDQRGSADRPPRAREQTSRDRSARDDAGRTRDERPKTARSGGPKPGASNRNIGGGKPRDSRPPGGKPGGSRPAGGRPTGGRPTGGKPTGGRPGGAKPTSGKPGGGRPGGGKPSGGRPSGKPGGGRSGGPPRGPSRPKR